jgi:hypothetical protein
MDMSAASCVVTYVTQRLITPEFSTCPCLKPPQFNHQSHPIAKRSILILSIHLYFGFLCGFLRSVFPSNNLRVFLFYPIRNTCSAHFILLHFIAKSTNHEDPHYKVLTILWSLHSSSVQIFSSAACSETPSVHGPPLLSKIKFPDFALHSGDDAATYA